MNTTYMKQPRFHARRSALRLTRIDLKLQFPRVQPLTTAAKPGLPCSPSGL
jgi:hypothetical protein